MGAYKFGVAMGLTCGIAAGLLLVPLLVRAMKKKGMQNDKCKFDERQELVRGKGGRYAFFTVLFYNFAYGFGDMLFSFPFIEKGVGIILGAFLGCLVYAGYCIWNEGYIALNEDRGRITVCFTILAAVNLGISAVNFWEGAVVVDGVLTFRSLNLFCGIMMVAVLGMMAFKRHCKEKEEA